MDTKKKKKISIRTKLILVIIPIVIFIVLVFFGLSRNMIITVSKDKLYAQSEVGAGQIYAWSNKILGELQIYKDAIEEYGFANDADILSFMEGSVEKSDDYPIGLYMGDDKGVYLDASGWVPDDDWVLTERDWYLEGLEHKELAFGEPYYDSQSGDICVSVTVRMSDPDRARVLAVDVYLNYLSELIAALDENGSQSFLLTGESRTVIAHSDPSMIAVTLDADGLDPMYQAIGKKLDAGKLGGGVSEIKGKKGSYFVCANQIEGTDWLLVSFVSQKHVLADLRKMETIMIGVAIVSALALIIIIASMMDKIVKPVARVTDVIQNVAAGDFSQNLEVKGNDEIAMMSAHTQEFLVQMRQTIADIIDIAKWLERQAEDNGSVSGSLRNSSQSQSEAMKTLRQVVTELSAAAEDVSRQMEELGAVIENAYAQGKSAGDTMRRTVEISENGRIAAERVSESMRHVNDSIASLSDQIMQTDKAVEQIGGMVDMIVSVAEETNLLSLNASIEAARAGEAGKGFAVVADQIGKLAVSSSSAADDIAKKTTEIKGAMSAAIAKMQESVDEVKVSAELVVENRQTFETVFAKVGETNQMVETMIELVDKAEKLAGSMSRIAEKQVREADEISRSAGELDGYTKTVADDSNTVAQNAQELERESKKLMEQMRKFTI